MMQKHMRPRFESHIISRGNSYYKNGSARLISNNDRSAKFIVTGSRKYTCRLGWKAQPNSKSDFFKNIKMSCTCPYFQDYGNCKHLWASVKLGEYKGLWDDIYDHFDSQPVTEKSAIKLKKNEDKPWQKKLTSLFNGELSHGNTKKQHEIYYSLEQNGVGVNVGFFTQPLGLSNRTKLFLKKVNLNDLSRYSQSDREILWLLLSREASYSYYEPVFECGEVNPHVQSFVFKKLCESGRFFRGWNSAVYDLDKITFLQHAESLSDFKVKISSKSKGVLVEGIIQDAYGSLPLKDIDSIYSDGTYFSTNKIGKFDERFYNWVSTLSDLQNEVIPKSDSGLLVQALFSYENTPQIELDPKLGWRKETKVRPTPKFIINDEGEKGYKAELYGSVSFNYGESEVFSLAAQSYSVDIRNKVLFERDYDAEDELLEVAGSLGMSTASQKFIDRYNFRIRVDRFVDVIKSFIERGWVVEAHGNSIQTAKDFDFSVKSGVDWFDLEGGVTFKSGQTVTLPELMRKMKTGEKLIPLGDGQYGMLPENWLEKYSSLAGIGKESSDGSLRFTKAQGLFLNGWFSGTKDLKSDQGFLDFQKTLKKSSLKKKAKALKAFNGDLRDYQEEGLAWLEYVRGLSFGGILADDMGLGKTVQIIALLQKHKRKMKEDKTPSLIVVPKSLVFNWKDELEKFAPSLKALIYVGVERFNMTSEDIKNADVVITTYHTLRNDFETLKEILFSYIILDEAQNIKNSKAQISQACKALSSENKLALTGTPIENSISDLFSILDFVNPGLISEKLRQKFSGATESSEDLKKLSKALSPMILRRTKQQVLTDLPDKVESTIKCELTKAERKQYNDLKKYYQLKISKNIEEKGFSRSKIEILEALLRLRQAACHPSLVDKQKLRSKSAKLDILFEQIHSLVSSGGKCLVFSQFTSFLNVIKPKLEREKIKYLYLDGKTRNRKKMVQEFESSDETKVFLISLKAGGVGLNLTSANYVFILDPWWNPAAESQAIDRAYRIGQKNNVFAYKLISKDTVEEKILELQKDKKNLSDTVIDSQAGMLKKMNVSDLNFLLS